MFSKFTVLSVNDAHGVSHWCWVPGQTLTGCFVQGTQTSQVKRVLFPRKAKIWMSQKFAE